jgi:uncharacterized protein YggE
MKSRLVLMSVLGLVGLLAVACKEGDTTINSTPADTTGITVSGKGEVDAPSDTGFLTMGVQVTATTVEDARNRAAAAADAVIKSVKSNGVDQEDIKTAHLPIQPQYDYKSGNEPRITGYLVTNTIEAKVRKLDNFSKIVDDAVKAGGNDARLQGIRFGIEDDAKLLEQAREAAMEDAKKKAEQLAKAGGVSLGKPLAISDMSTPSPLFETAKTAQSAGAADIATPIEPGTGTVVVQLSVRWSLK